MKLNDEVSYVSVEAVSTMAKATEIFCQLLALEASKAVIKNKKKVLRVEDMIEAIGNNQDQFEFLNTAYTGACANSSLHDQLLGIDPKNRDT